ncbi:hypothetical protein [Agriterribacter sp.]|uniref:hypothetical protein n=1 Tax=Agriterribacter sp. TaxID=2821509 RepID=UPI002C9FFC3D|nr:hypothetical protein [Agriterribacter sp.]HRP54567.1 hypothetical protein [Agriterribacter sp.]
MDNNEIEKLIESEKEQLTAFLKLAEKFQISEEEIEKQINFYLEKISELKQRLKKG